MYAESGDEAGCLKCHRRHYTDKGQCIHCHQGKPRASREAIAHFRLIPSELAGFRLPGNPSAQKGREIIDDFACRRCHTIDGKGNTLAQNLDRLMPGADTSRILSAISDPVTFMPEFSFSKTWREHVVTALLATSAANRVADRERFLVHFKEQGSREIVFEEDCGGCHQVLSRQHGSLGNNTMGPNLSGLMSRFYPHTFKDDKPWNRERLKTWIENPRAVRENARMPPVRLDSERFKKMMTVWGE